MTIFATAMTSGILLALAAHMLSGRFGIDPTSAWRDLIPNDANAVRSALGWWLILGTGFAGSFLAGLLTQNLSGGQRQRGRPRQMILIVFILMLAGVPYLSAAAPASSLPITLGTNLAVFALGTITAFCGSWFAMSR